MSSTTQSAPSWQHGKVAGWIVSVDHKRIGALYLGWAGVFFIIAAILTVLMRLQMTRPNASILGDSTYKGVLTMHGTLLVFFVLVPVVIGLATYLVPLMIGANRIAMPGLAAAALWLFAFAGIAVVLSAFASGGSSKDGWTGYPPGTLTQEGNGVRLWLMGLFLLALSVAASAVNLAATIRSLRAEGMDWDKTPLFAWSVYVWSVVTIVLAPLAAIGLGLILLERRFNGSFDFFLTGDQTVKPWLIWLFGQSFAYAALVPVVGILAEIVAVFAGRAIASARTLAQALVGIGGLTLVLVLYHAYAGGIGRKPSVVLLILAVIATIPSVVALVLLKKTLWQARGGIRWTAPMLFAGGAIVLFAIGLLSALALAIFGNNRDWRGTAFGVAHAHYLIWGTALLALLGGLVYWWPKVFGRLLGTRLTRVVGVAALHRLQLHVLRPVPARRQGPAGRSVELLRARQHLGLQHDLDDRRGRDDARRAGLPARGCPGAQRQARGQRPVARRHARVVHDLAAAAAQLRLRAGDHERAPARRPAPHAPGAQCALAPAPRASRRGRSSAARSSPRRSRRGIVVASATIDSGRGHWAAALVALPLLVAAVIIARIAYPRLLAATATALGLMLAAIASGGLIALVDDATWTVALHVAAAGASLAASLVALVLSFRGDSVPLGPWRDYITLTKPRIMSLLLITGAAGMFVGAEGWPGGWLLLTTMAGLALACGGSSALNHVMDADIDKLMGERTAARPVASGRVAAPRALEFGVVLMALSFALLATTVNVLTAALALVGGLFYVVVYTGYLKRSTDQNIVIGGAAGAVPPLVGFAAASGNLTLPALWLFLIVFLWTPPHFWALALMIKEHYAAASVPMLPGTKGDRETTRQILLYSIVMVAFTVAVGWWLGPVYTAAAVLLGAYFLLLAWQLRRDTSRRRAFMLFHYSLAYLALLFVAAAIDPLLV